MLNGIPEPLLIALIGFVGGAFHSGIRLGGVPFRKAISGSRKWAWMRFQAGAFMTGAGEVAGRSTRQRLPLPGNLAPPGQRRSREESSL